MTLDGLREQLKAHYAVYMAVVDKGRRLGLNPPKRNMREDWVEVGRRIEPFRIDGEWIKVVDKRWVAFYHAGELYYHAKKHGLQSAMLLRLYRS